MAFFEVEQAITVCSSWLMRWGSNRDSSLCTTRRRTWSSARTGTFRFNSPFQSAKTTRTGLINAEDHVCNERSTILKYGKVCRLPDLWTGVKIAWQGLPGPADYRCKREIRVRGTKYSPDFMPWSLCCVRPLRLARRCRIEYLTQRPF